MENTVIAASPLDIPVMPTDEHKPTYSPDNWAHQALLLMDEAEVLVRWAAVSHPDPEKYKEAAKAFWDVCHMLAAERSKLHNAISTAKPAV